MPITYGISEEDKLQLDVPKSVYSGWGKDDNDFIRLLIYDESGDILYGDEILKPQDVSFSNEQTIDIDVGTHLRSIGSQFSQGRFTVQYLFLRRLAGQKKSVLINEDGFIHVGKVRTQVVNGRPRFFSDKGGEDTPLSELFERELKYLIKEISPNRREVKVDVKQIQNVPYQKNFASINKDMVYIPKTNTPGAGKIRFDLTDPNVLLFEPGTNERGFTDSMVGGEIVIKEMFEFQPPPPPPVVEDDEDDEIDDERPRPKEEARRRFLDAAKEIRRKLKRAIKEAVSIPVTEQVQDTPAPDNDYQDYDEFDDYGSACFVGDTKIRLSNNRMIPIKMMKPGMKVKTNQGFAKVKKVVKDNRPYGDGLAKYGNLITTAGHPIKHKGSWYRADEVGTQFNYPPLDVYNLILDKHHTVYANNVVSATLGKWKSMDHFLTMRKNRINMLRLAEDQEDSPGSSGGGGGSALPPAQNPNNRESVDEFEPPLGKPGLLEPGNEYIVDEPMIPTTRDVVLAVAEEEGELPDKVPIDYVATITEVLDFNKVRVDLSYEAAATKFDHSGEQQPTKVFDEFYVNYRKNNVGRLNNYMVSDDGMHLCIMILDAPAQSLPLNDGTLPINDIADKKARYIKLYEPLPDTIEVNSKVYFVEEKMEPYEDTIDMIPFEEDLEELLYLRVPNFNSKDNPINFQGTGFQTMENIVGTDTTTQQEIADKLFSSSLLDVQVNVDYQKRTEKFIDFSDYAYGNFNQFGSAELRLRNMKKKVELIQNYTKEINDLTNVTGSLSSLNRQKTLKRRVINSFDPYENFLYTVSSSYISSSVGEFYDSSWPKEGAAGSTSIYHTSHSVFTGWYDTQISYAQDYDKRNDDRLVNQLPAFVRNDTSNIEFLNFTDMIGQQFDEIWSYVRHFTDVNERSSKVSEGISKDIVREVGKQFGIKFTNGNDLVIVPTYLLGKDIDGGALNESPSESLTEEIWKRILDNLPFFLKTKGTVRALKGLINCYGIPSSILRVREYGGPNLPGQRVAPEIKRKFTYALDFKSNNILIAPWSNTDSPAIKPQTIEFRYRSLTPSKDQQIMQASGSKGSWAINLRDNGAPDNKGHLEFAISGSGTDTFITSSELPVYNGDFWSVMLTRISGSGIDLNADEDRKSSVKYELTCKQYDATRETILYQDSSSLTTDGTTSNGQKLNDAFITNGNLFIGGSGSVAASNTNHMKGVLFSGSMMEFRLWSEPLSQSVFDNHVRAPQAYNGNTTASQYDNLEYRLTMGDNVNLDTFPNGIDDKSFRTSYATGSDATLFADNPFRSVVDKEELQIPNIGPSRRNATKIRVEPTNLVGGLSVNVRREASAYDTAPTDSNKLGIYFSPVDVVNEDIIYSLANFDIDDQIGDPRDQYEYEYRGLEKTQREYWKKYARANNFWDYMRILQYYDKSIWDQLKTMVPARANTTFGILIEPNILERAKEVVGKQPEFENTFFENANQFQDGVQLTNRLSQSIHPFRIDGEFPTFESELNLNSLESGSLGFLGIPSLTVLDEINPKSEYGTLYATASVTFGGITSDLTDPVMTFVSSSRISEHNEIKQKFYSSSLSASIDNPYSASFHPAEFQSVSYDSSLFRVYYKPITLTKKNTIDGNDPVEITITSPTKLVVKESGESALKVE